MGRIRYFACADGPGTFTVIDQDVPFTERTIATGISAADVIEVVTACEALDNDLAHIDEAAW